MKFTLTFAVIVLAMVMQARPAPKASMSLADKIAALSKVDEVTEGMLIN